MKIQDGFLFTTASPCELCAKKAYQIGIKNIFYIDLYPGISQSHVLENGKIKNRPELILFHGAIGRAYIQFYTPLLPYKDEMYMLLETNFREIEPNKRLENIAMRLMGKLSDKELANKLGLDQNELLRLRKQIIEEGLAEKLG